MPKKRAKESRPQAYQFTLGLLDIEPLIWRRIQVLDCTLDQLHMHIQTAMGWTNTHLHQFEIGGACYGDPALLEDADITDSATVTLSRLLERRRKRFRFHYEYDFGDGWRHEIVYEGAVDVEPRVKYPRCVDGARACPPEDIGGPFGYLDFADAMVDAKNPRHDDFRDWYGGDRFDPERFSIATTTKAMRQGLPDWREHL